MSLSLRDLLEAGVHFGHQTSRWNPKMRQYVYGAKNGIHIMDLQKTARGLVEACRFVSTTVAGGGQILCVGTKRAAREIVGEESERAGMFFVNHRWLGGTMTNYQTVKKSVERLVQLERARDEGRFEILTKKEALELNREIAKMSRNLGGIKTMRGLPAALFVIDPKKEHIAVKEANTLKIPVIAVCDSNCDPSGVSYVIPGNDDALKAIRLFTAAIADAVIEGRRSTTNRGAQGAYSSDAKVEKKRAAAPAAAPEAVAPAAPAPEVVAAEAVAPAAEAAPASTEAGA